MIRNLSSALENFRSLAAVKSLELKIIFSGYSSVIASYRHWNRVYQQSAREKTITQVMELRVYRVVYKVDATQK